MGKGDLLKARNLKRYINQVFLNYDIKMVTLMCIKNFAYHVKNFTICVDHYLSCNETKKMYGFSFHFCSAYYCKSAQWKENPFSWWNRLQELWNNRRLWKIGGSKCQGQHLFNATGALFFVCHETWYVTYSHINHFIISFNSMK